MKKKKAAAPEGSKNDVSKKPTPKPKKRLDDSDIDDYLMSEEQRLDYYHGLVPTEEQEKKWEEELKKQSKYHICSSFDVDDLDKDFENIKKSKRCCFIDETSTHLIYNSKGKCNLPALVKVSFNLREWYRLKITNDVIPKHF